MDWFGVFLLIIGGWILVSTISGVIANHNRSATGWFWQIIWLIGGGYALYVGYQKVMAPPPTLLGSVTGAVAGGRRR